MKMKRLLSLILCLCALGARAQVPAAGKLSNMAASLDSFRNRVPVEKVHIQFDKPYYALGDTIWMKAYVVDESNLLSPLSKLVYVELLSDADSVKIGLRLPVTAGLAWGSITLSDSLLTEGNYHIRAYTTLMRNFPSEFFFDKPIKIGNGIDPAARALLAQLKAGVSLGNALAKADTAISVQFFPEGGDMVNGLSSVVAFKALGTDGLSRDVSGTVVDKAGKVVVGDLHAEHAGMGTFTLLPEAGNAYSAVITFAGGLQKKFALPKAKDTGYGLSVTQNEVNMVVRIDAAEALLNKGEVSLVVQANNMVLYTGRKVLSASGFVTVIPKKRFPGGILQFTLFAPDYTPVAERLVFLRRDEHLNVRIVPDKPDYTKRGKVHLNLEVTGADGKPAIGAFSMAVTDDGKVPYNEADEKTIFSNLLLTSNLKGFVEHPNYYFMDTTAVRLRQLDNLLLTQGWRRFVWQDVLADKLPVLSYQPDNGPGIGGRVAASNGKGSPYAKVHLLVGGMLVDTVANALGVFRFDGVSLGKEVKYNVVATDAKGKKNVTVQMDREKVPDFPSVLPLPREAPLKEEIASLAAGNNSSNNSGNGPVAAATTANNPVKNKDGSRMLKEVEIKDQRKTIEQIATQFRDQRLPTPDRIFTFIDLDRVNNISSYFSTRVPGVPPTPNGDLPGLVIINGHVASRGEMGAIPPDQIAAIEFFASPMAAEILGVGHSGIILVSLRNPTYNYQSLIDTHDDEVRKEKEKSIMLKQVEIKAKNDNEILKVALKFKNNLLVDPDQVFTFVDLDKVGNLAGFLAGHLGNIHINPRPDGSFTATYQGLPVAVLVDGRLVTDPSQLLSFSPDRIAAIEVVKGLRAGIVAKGANGAIAITLKDPTVAYQPYIDAHDDAVQQDKVKAINLKQVEITAKKEDEVKKIALKNSRNLSGPADQVLTFVDLSDCSSLGLCLAGKLSGVRVTPSPNGSFTAQYEGGDMPVIVDGQEVKPDFLTTISSDQIAAVEVIKGARAGINSKKAVSGVLIITLKTGGVDYNKYIEEHDTEKLRQLSLKAVTITSKKEIATVKSVATQHSANLAGPGNADQVLTFMDLLTCGGKLSDCLAGRLVNVVFKNGVPYTRGFDSPMYVVVDGMGDRDLGSINPADVSSIEVLRGGGAASLYGMKGANGILIITTKQGDVDYASYIPGYHPYNERKPALVNYKFHNGYDLRRQFYSPDYDNPNTNKQLIDPRTTIYWNPNIVTDENGKAHVSFFNADGMGSYKVITEGLSPDGQLGRQVYKYGVK